MQIAPTCLTAPILIKRMPYQRLPHKKTAAARCHDCGVAPGGIHHLGCDCERCPNCRGQLISCDCEGKELAVGVGSVEPAPEATS